MANRFGNELKKRLSEVEQYIPAPKGDVLERIKNGEEIKSPHNPIPFAIEFVEHYYGMETDNFLIDLTMEINHVAHFREHVLNQNLPDEMSVDLMQSLESYHHDLKEYYSNLCRREIEHG